MQSISYLRQVDGCLQWVGVGLKSVSYYWEVCGCLHGVCELCHSLEAGWWFSAECVLCQLFVGG